MAKLAVGLPFIQEVRSLTSNTLRQGMSQTLLPALHKSEWFSGHNSDPGTTMYGMLRCSTFI